MKESTFNKYCLVVDEWFINGFNGTKAYQKFYPESTDESAESSFREIVGNSRIKEYKESKQQKTSNTLQITLESQLLELDNIKTLSTEGKEYNNAINALKEQNKLLGLYSEHNSQKIPQMSTEERELRIQELQRKINVSD